jgi:hypothetical protein
VTIEGQSVQATPPGQGIQVELVGHPAAMSPPEAPVVNRDGTFVLRSVPVGEYQVKLRGVQGPYYAREVRLGPNDILGQTISIRGPMSATLEIVVSRNPGTIEGTVVDAQFKAVPGIQVVLIPDRLRDRLDLYKAATTDSSGKFRIGSITPGDYRIYSWEELDAYSYFDPAVVREFEFQGKPVHVSEMSNENVEIRLIPATQ